MRVTKSDVFASQPCYGLAGGTWNQKQAERWLAGLWPGGREAVTAREVADCEALSFADRLWFLIQLLTPRAQRLFACAQAERALELLSDADVDPRSRAAIDVARRHADGLATDEELEAAAWEAWKARAASWTSEAAAMAAAMAASRAASWTAEVAWAAARAASWTSEAPWAAAAALAARAEKVRQLDALVAILDGSTG